MMMKGYAFNSTGEKCLICREKVGSFKAPDAIHLLPELPKGPSGKIQRIKLPEMFAEKQSG